MWTTPGTLVSSRAKVINTTNMNVNNHSLYRVLISSRSIGEDVVIISHKLRKTWKLWEGISGKSIKGLHAAGR